MHALPSGGALQHVFFESWELHSSGEETQSTRYVQQIPGNNDGFLKGTNDCFLEAMMMIF
jgi:hypothetical protein